MWFLSGREWKVLALRSCCAMAVLVSGTTSKGLPPAAQSLQGPIGGISVAAVGRRGPRLRGRCPRWRTCWHLKAAWQVSRQSGVIGHSRGASLVLLSAIEHPESTGAFVYISGTGAPSWWRDAGRAANRRERAARLSPVEQERLADLESIDRTKVEEVEFRTLSWITDLATPGGDPSQPWSRWCRPPTPSTGSSTGHRPRAAAGRRRAASRRYRPVPGALSDLARHGRSATQRGGPHARRPTSQPHVQVGRRCRTPPPGGAATGGRWCDH